jgi:hypothetical protein
MYELLPKHPLRSANLLHLILGLCVLMSPFLLGFADLRAMKWNNVAAGIAVLVLALGENGPHRAGSVFNALLGGWLIASPFVLGYTSPAPFWTNVILGIAIFSTALIAATHRPVHLHREGPPATR